MADDDSRSGLRYTDPALLGWLDDLHAGLDPALRQAFEAPGQQGMPAIQVGRSEGRLLSLLTRLIGATKAVEVGTLAGFSAIHIARGLAPGGHLWSIEYDPHHAEVARAALDNGAAIVNDVSGGRADPAMAGVVAAAGVPWILMHWRSVSAGDPHRVPGYGDVVAEVRAELLGAVDAAVAAGVDPARVIIDPGLGFAKTAQHNWALLHALPELVGTGIPVLIGASRKRFLGALLAADDGQPRPPDGRETATAVVSALAAGHGAWGVRVHDVTASVDALAVLAAWNSGGGGG